MQFIVATAQSASLPGDVVGNVANHLRFAAAAAKWNVQLLVFPELSLIGYELSLARANVVDPECASVEPLRRFAGENGLTIVAGAPLAGRDVLHIGAIVFGADGSISTYTKQHVHSSEQHVFTSGPGGGPLQIGSARVALSICADATHPEHAAAAAANGAGIYAVGAMIVVPDYTRKSGLLQRYATDHRMAVLLANYAGSSGGDVSAGKSAFWSEDGQPVVTSAGNEEELLVLRKQAAGWSGTVVSVPPAAIAI